ncbi:hypothetical protein FBEOM_2970 [Fusarium beomiforme]|uniref:Uncharacterized protein n=1 Tax=Fusarium beomiforme TaxID=44412 RepID=A0A9P5AQY7_9HYPO|nr:hypothetical protein FBEOM_2970 [Fusarium beomiforme]
MQALRSYEPKRRSLNFSQLHRDLPDEFYEYHFARISAEIWAIVSSAFCPKEEHQAPLMSPWLWNYSAEFIQHVEFVARLDARAGKWERLLRDGEERKNLFQAIIFKVLDNWVFSSLLFGASSKHLGALQVSDSALINTEGFQRNELLSHTNRTWLLAHNGEPPRFWVEVDKLSSEILVLLLPAYEFMASFTDYEPIAKTELYQLLHEVTAYAGWLSVGIRMSPAIVSINWPIPGEMYSLDQVNTCQAAYDASRKAARKYQERLRNKRPEQEEMVSRARVKISVLPEIVRHQPYPKEIETEGIVSYKIMEPHAVFYEGMQQQHDENKAFISLSDYIKKLRDRNCTPRNTALAIMVAMLICLWVLYTTSGQQTWQRAHRWVISEPEPEPEKSWWSQIF